MRVSRTSSLALASTAVLLLCAARSAGFAASGAVDLGPIDAATPITATLWLAPHDAAAFALAVTERQNPASPLYHRWMTPDELAGQAATADEIATLSRALEANGLQIVRREADGSSLRVTGSAAAMAATFATTLHEFERGGRRYYANLAEPRFTGAEAGLIAGITGLSSEPVAPLVRRQLDPSTGAPVPAQPLTTGPDGVLNPYTVFTDACFKAQSRLDLVHFVPGGNSVSGVYAGPKYVTRNLPSKQFTTCGYTAEQVASQYGLQAVYARGYTGKGQTIVLVDAYGSPTIQIDANIFSQMMGLPALTAANFQTVYSDGPPVAPPDTTDWPLEISLDVEWAHAVAPEAKIVLVVAPSDDLTELAYAVHYAVTHQLGGIISNSYGQAEAGTGPTVARSFNAVMQQAAAAGIAVNVAAGDAGDFGLGTPVGAASIPADSPFVTAVGGTSLNVPSDDGPVDTAWGFNDTFLGDVAGASVPPLFAGFVQGGGGGSSLVLAKPSWQHGLAGVGRQLPDVAAVADPQTGGIIVSPASGGAGSVALTIGGTSLSTPVFSGIWALAQQAAGEPLGQAGPILAGMSPTAFTDIVPVQASRSNLHGTTTDPGAMDPVTHYTPQQLLGLATPNGFVGVLAEAGEDGFYDISFGADSSLTTLPGWDTATGFGEPNGLAFIKAAQAAAAK